MRSLSAWLRRTPAPLIEAVLVLRALPFVGNRYLCPCCGWRLRAFVASGRSLRTRPDGFCPRCNSKARHRRIWLYLQQRTTLLSDRLSVLEVAPRYCFSRVLARAKNIRYVGADLAPGPHVSVQMDLTASPLSTESFDVVICVHVLEEVPDDRAAMGEIFRMLKPGGWALVSVPTRLDRLTHEDPSITSPKERRRVFGETAHVRVYGHDLVDRLRATGFHVEVDLARDVDHLVRARHGLRDDENIFRCTKPPLPDAAHERTVAPALQHA